MPTMRGRNQPDAASGTMPRRAKTKPKRAVSDARRMSIGSVIVAPMPTAGPLIAPMIGFRQRNMRSVTSPPPSRCAPSLPVIPSRSASSRVSSESNVSPPLERSAPAQKPRPRPVTTTTRTSSSASTRSNACSSSNIIVPVNALSLSGRSSVIVATPSATS